MRSYFPILVVLILVFSRLYAAQSISCESSGQCQQTSGICQYDSIEKCYPNSGANLQYFYSPSGNCASSGIQSDIRLKDLTVKYIHINPNYVRICVNWSLVNSSGSTGGYKIRLVPGLESCIGESSQMSICIDNIGYNRRYGHRIEVLPNPLAADDNENLFKKSLTLDADITGCAAADVQDKSPVCVKRYNKPRNLLVISTVCEDGTKTLNVSWDHREDMPIPDAYYVQVKNASEIHYFKITNATQILVRNLSVAINYSARVQAYRLCSGLGVYGYDEETLGCGRGVTKPETRRQGSCLSTTTFEATGNATPAILTGGSSTTTEQEPILSLAGQGNSKTVLIIALPIAVVIIAIIALTGALGILYLVIYRKKSKVSPARPAKTDFSVFLFCSPSMSLSKLEHIHNHITVNLSEYYRVVTMDELVNGDMTKWLEKMVNSVDLVLIMANEEFVNDWESVTRPPELYCMESLISAAVVQGTITKFAFISTENSTSSVSIPENSYLKLMQVFLMGTKTNQEKKLYHFVTKSRAIMLEPGVTYNHSQP